MESLVEDGNATTVVEEFAGAEGGVWDGVVVFPDPPGIICYGESAELQFTIELVNATTHYFSYASMVVPSNDAWVANGNATQYPIYTEKGEFIPLTITVLGTDVLDAGTEVNDERNDTTAAFGQSVPNTGEDENGVVTSHPGFNEIGSGGILDSPMFENANFSALDYGVMTITVTMGPPSPGGAPTPPGAPTTPGAPSPSGPSPSPPGGSPPTDGGSSAAACGLGAVMGSILVMSLLFVW